MYTNIKSLCCIPEANIIYMSIITQFLKNYNNKIYYICALHITIHYYIQQCEINISWLLPQKKWIASKKIRNMYIIF